MGKEKPQGFIGLSAFAGEKTTLRPNSTSRKGEGYETIGGESDPESVGTEKKKFTVQKTIRCKRV